MANARDPPKAQNTSITLSTGVGNVAVLFADHDMSPEIDTNYGVNATLQEVLVGTATLVYFYISAKTVTGFTLNLVATGATDGAYAVSWKADRGKNKF